MFHQPQQQLNFEKWDNLRFDTFLPSFRYRRLTFFKKSRFLTNFDQFLFEKYFHCALFSSGRYSNKASKNVATSITKTVKQQTTFRIPRKLFRAAFSVCLHNCVKPQLVFSPFDLRRCMEIRKIFFSEEKNVMLLGYNCDMKEKLACGLF